MKGGLLTIAAFLLVGLAGQTLSAADLSGKWVFSFRTPDGNRDVILELKQDGDRLSATFDKFELERAATGEGFTLKGDHFVPAAGYPSQMAISGKPDGEGLAGEASWDEYVMTFTAKRAE